MDLVERLREARIEYAALSQDQHVDELRALDEAADALEVLLRAVEPFVALHMGEYSRQPDEFPINAGCYPDLRWKLKLGDFRFLTLAVQAVKGGG